MSTCLAGTLLENLRNSMWEIPSDKSASGDGTARQLDVKRPTRRSATPDSPEVLFWEVSR
jgi:hypothetical protein